MVESSAHGDEYDGVIFSQLVSCILYCCHKKCECHSLECIICLFLQNLIDLAGSESSKTETTGLRRKEGSYINKSLLTLGTVNSCSCVCSTLFFFFSIFLYANKNAAYVLGNQNTELSVWHVIIDLAKFIVAWNLTGLVVVHVNISYSNFLSSFIIH